MVCTEYPPMQGGVGRYTHNLVKSLVSNNIDIIVVSSSDGSGDYNGISPYNRNNSELLLKLVKEIKPDIVHVQHEFGLYGFFMNPIRPSKTSTGLDKFYDKCKSPIVTTFHTSMYFRQWARLMNIKERDNDKDFLRIYSLYKYWRHLINYSSMHRINKDIMSKSAYGIVLSNYMEELIPGTNLLYHGSAPYFKNEISRNEARKRMYLPENGRLALAQGFITNTKGWDIIRKIRMPKDWRLVVNHSKNFYNNEKIDFEFYDDKVINLNKRYLSEEELSLLFFACDAVFLPYKVCSGSGVMFDGLGHGKPFVASNLGFFKEFSLKKLGIVTKRDPRTFENAFVQIDKNYKLFESNVKEFRKEISWDNIAKQHISIYKGIITDKLSESLPVELIRKTKIRA
ncbi:MAG TPA: glycosyltransferase [Candidatus Nitrosocosmicus sp.]|nr:glycosyltransferase [Candidatus Nitrosocosmicus sp.]